MQLPRLCYRYSPRLSTSILSRAILQTPERESSRASAASHELYLPLGRQSRSSRIFRASMSTAASSHTVPKFSAGSDESSLYKKLQTLLPPGEGNGSQAAAPGGRWALIPSGEGLERSFKFKTFAKTWVSVSSVLLIFLFLCICDQSSRTRFSELPSVCISYPGCSVILGSK